MKRPILVSLLIILFSCQKNEPSGICGEGNNLCFEMNGTPQTYYAKWDTDSIGYKMYAENIYVTDTHSIEVRVFQHTPIVQTINFNTFIMTGDGIVRYYINSSPLPSVDGEIKIENVYQNRITGNFNAIMYDSLYSYELTNGHLDAIPHQ